MKINIYFCFAWQQTKRKLDDVSKRLESLYDLLRENRVNFDAIQIENHEFNNIFIMYCLFS